jgi:large subunit ribosomal protein L20
MRAQVMATKDRQRRKRDFRRLWITRLSAACAQRTMRYSQFIAGLRRAGVALDRKQMSEMAISSPEAFDKLVVVAREQLAATA